MIYAIEEAQPTQFESFIDREYVYYDFFVYLLSSFIYQTAVLKYYYFL